MMYRIRTPVASPLPLPAVTETNVYYPGPASPYAAQPANCAHQHVANFEKLPGPRSHTMLFLPERRVLINHVTATTTALQFLSHNLQIKLHAHVRTVSSGDVRGAAQERVTQVSSQVIRTAFCCCGSGWRDPFALHRDIS